MSHSPPGQRGLTAEDFDEVIGNCMATTDMPGATFACELIRAYPDAKIIINKRDDVDTWYESVINSFDNAKDPSPIGQWRTALFNTNLFWIKLGRIAMWEHMMNYNFAQNGKDVYRKHYRELDELLEVEAGSERQRHVLRWKVEDGWRPLVAFLEKDVPMGEDGMEVEFPKGNAPDEFQKKRMAMVIDKVKRANRRRRVFLSVIVGLLAGGMGWYWWRST